MTTPSDASQAVELPPLPGMFECASVTARKLIRDYAHAAIAQDRAARAQAEPVAWQWRKRQTWFAGKPDETSFWSEWEALQPPYMDALDLAKSDPANYEIRPLYAAARAQGAGEAVAPRENAS